MILYFISQPIESDPKEVKGIESLTKEEFFQELSPYAEKLEESHGVRPSLLLAQAALESNWGKSELAQESNNYFGIKNAKGRKYATKEFRQEEWEETQSYFKEYDSLEDSMTAYADLLKNGTSWNEDLYQEVIEADHYEKAAYALKEAGYATDPSYAEKLIRLIEEYQLNEYDGK
ncbi:MAG: glycoside hydrolase family 73 protein [Atopostipes sp.]|nr:glycoside hydrolase family 73 protein [Atopostipes sp.]